TYQDHPEDMKKAGIEYAAQQIQDLKEHQVDGIHIYTMNHADTAKSICRLTGL
ncbi:MAG: methylenetetrahydrofolate reductase, partial [Eubacterium sp.]|nr:methylenetetrahydrofolate reductase [Eubacterium sp.]